MPITDQEVLAAVNEIIATRGVQEELASFDEQFITHPDWACTDFAGDLFRVLTRPPGRQYFPMPVNGNAPAGSYFHLVRPRIIPGYTASVSISSNNGWL